MSTKYSKGRALECSFRKQIREFLHVNFKNWESVDLE